MGGRGQGFTPPVPNEEEQGQARALRIAHRSGGGENYYGRSGPDEAAERERLAEERRNAGFFGMWANHHSNRNNNNGNNNNGNGFGGN